MTKSHHRKSITVTLACVRRRLASLVRNHREGPEIVVFSMDRAAQLEMLLDSYLKFVEDAPALTVLYRASSAEHLEAYRMVFTEPRFQPFVKAVAERDFRSDLLGVLNASRRIGVMFLVDDLVFIRPVPRMLMTSHHPAHAIVSLRLGRPIKRSFNYPEAPCPPPSRMRRIAAEGQPPLLRWRWRDGLVDWGFPTALDATLLPLREILPILEREPYRAPNSLELALGRYRALFNSRSGICPESPCVVNLPLNSVKTENYHFPCLNVEPQSLLNAFMQGARLRLTRDLADHDSVHMPWEPELVSAAAPAAPRP